MLGRRGRPFPIEIARDLLGVVRVLYATARSQGARGAEIERFARPGRLLREAIDLARRYPVVDCVGHRAAWKKGEEAVALVGGLVHAVVPLEPLVEVARERVTGERRQVVLRAQRKQER